MPAKECTPNATTPGAPLATTHETVGKPLVASVPREPSAGGTHASAPSEISGASSALSESNVRVTSEPACATDGAIDETAGGTAYVKSRTAPGATASPSSSECTTTATVAAAAGAVVQQRRIGVLSAARVAHAAPPMLTATAAPFAEGPRLVPVMQSFIPPSVEPVADESDSTVSDCAVVSSWYVAAAAATVPVPPPARVTRRRASPLPPPPSPLR